MRSNRCVVNTAPSNEKGTIAYNITLDVSADPNPISTVQTAVLKRSHPATSLKVLSSIPSNPCISKRLRVVFETGFNY